MIMANDIRSLTDVDEVTPNDMGVQRLGKVTVRAGIKSFDYLSGSATRISTPTGKNSEFDPNNVVAKFDDRFDDPTYY